GRRSRPPAAAPPWQTCCVQPRPSKITFWIASKVLLNCAFSSHAGFPGGGSPGGGVVVPPPPPPPPPPQAARTAQTPNAIAARTSELPNWLFIISIPFLASRRDRGSLALLAQNPAHLGTLADCATPSPARNRISAAFGFSGRKCCSNGCLAWGVLRRSGRAALGCGGRLVAHEETSQEQHGDAHRDRRVRDVEGRPVHAAPVHVDEVDHRAVEHAVDEVADRAA